MSEPQDKVDVGSLKDTFMECPVCVEHFNQTDRRPRLLHSCLHAFCTQCLQQLLNKEGRGKITCPLCRKVEKVTGNADTLEVDSLRDKLVEFLQIKQDKKVFCSECLEKTAAVSRCEECQSYLCKECDFVHRRHRVSRDHSILSLNDVLKQPIQSFGKGHFCPNHPKHHLEFYCATEEKLCCVSCTVLDHRDHELQKLEKAAATRKEELDTKIKQVHAHANRLREERKGGTQGLKCIEETKARSILDINRIFDDLKQRLDDRKRELIENVQRNSSSLSSVINKTMASHEQTLAMIESTDTYFAQAKQKADAVEMLEIYPSIKRSIDSLSVQRQSSKTRGNEDAYNLQFKPTKSEDLLCLIREFGTFTTLPEKIFTEDQGPTHLDSQTALPELSRSATLEITPEERDQINEKELKRATVMSLSIDAFLQGKYAQIIAAQSTPHAAINNPLEPSSTPEQRIDKQDDQVFKLGCISVLVYAADITKLSVDAIVNGANEHLSHGSGVAKAILDAAGKALDDEGKQYVHKNGPIPVSGVVRTTAGRMPCRMVFHAVGPAWHDYKDYEKKRCQDDLFRTILQCLIEANNAKVGTVAIPAISSGIFRVPKEKCCDAYVRATKLFSQWTGSQLCLKEVHFVDKSESMLKMIASTFSESMHSTISPSHEEGRLRNEYMKQGVRQRSRRRGRQASSTRHGGQTTHTVREPDAVSTATTSYTYSVGGKGVVKLYKGDIVKASVHALVTWEDSQVKPCTSASEAITKATGDIKLDHRPKDLLCVSCSHAGNMSDKRHIFHAIVPVQSLSLADLQELLKRVLKTSDGNGDSTALTPLTTGKVNLEGFAKTFCNVTTETMKELKLPEIHMIDENPKVIASLKKIFDSCLTLESQEETMDIDVAGATGGEKECSICKDTCTDPKMLKCGHRFCSGCIDHYFNNYKPVCPNCGAIYGPVSGTMPKGEMRFRVDKYSHLMGHPHDGTICITYNIPYGIQTEEHPNPGKPYIGALWTCYLPDSAEGRKVLRLLKVAFDRRLTFTVGRSVTTGVENKVTWNDIHHKTSYFGNFGYPDPDYLKRVQEELAAKGVTEADIDWSTPV